MPTAEWLLVGAVVGAAVGDGDGVVPFDVGTVAAVFGADNLAVGEDRFGDERAAHRGGAVPPEPLDHLDAFAVVEHSGEERVLGEHPARDLERDVPEAGDHTDLVAFQRAAAQRLRADHRDHLAASALR